MRLAKIRTRFRTQYPHPPNDRFHKNKNLDAHFSAPTIWFKIQTHKSLDHFKIPEENHLVGAEWSAPNDQKGPE